MARSIESVTSSGRRVPKTIRPSACERISAVRSSTRLRPRTVQISSWVSLASRLVLDGFDVLEGPVPFALELGPEGVPRLVDADRPVPDRVRLLDLEQAPILQALRDAVDLRARDVRDLGDVSRRPRAEPVERDEHFGLVAGKPQLFEGVDGLVLIAAHSLSPCSETVPPSLAAAVSDCTPDVSNETSGPKYRVHTTSSVGRTTTLARNA